MNAATKASWKCEDFKSTIPLPYSDSFTARELEIIKAGLIPREMEDKWFIYFEGDTLYLHRSWTGQPVYKVLLDTNGEQAKVREAHVSSAVGKSDLDYHARLLDFLISNLLLGKRKPFPMPAQLKEPMPGVFQHHISGTGYNQSKPPPGKKWWQFWK